MVIRSFLGGGWSKANYEGFDKDLGSARYELDQE